MKIDDGPLNRYLTKNLQPLSEADPSLLANYVAALLKNNKPKKELQKLCIDQLYDFLGDGTKLFVTKLFHALEDGTIPSTEDMESTKQLETGSVVSKSDTGELKTSSPQLERLPSTGLRSFSDEGEDETSDDEDDDRNHKHRRRVTRSRSFDRDGEDGVDRGLYRKRGRPGDNGQSLRESESQGNERRVPGHPSHTERDGTAKFERRLGRDHGAGRFNTDVAQRGGMRGGQQFRTDLLGPRFDNANGMNGLIRGGLGRGRGLGGAWAHDQRFPLPPFPDGAEFPPTLLPPGPPNSNFFPGRAMPGRGAPISPWPAFGPLPGMGNGPMDHAHTLGGNLQGGRVPPMTGMGINMNVTMARPRCPDFEERGYCLRGDLCPMEHGANRIVVEDVQSLSKFNLPVSLPSGRNMGIGSISGQSSGPMLPPGASLSGRANRGNRETSLPGMSEHSHLLNGGVTGNGAAEPDSYDPDQPLWNKDCPEVSSGLRTSGLRKMQSFSKGSQDQDWVGDPTDIRETREDGNMDTGRLGRAGLNSNGGLQTVESGASVWDRIGPVDRVGSRLDGGLRVSGGTVEVLVGKQGRKDISEDSQNRGRNSWQGKWNREIDMDEDVAAVGGLTNLLLHARGRGTGRGDIGGQRSGEGTSYGTRVTGGRGSTGVGTERAQRTLYVSFIPTNSNRTELLLAHFQKFGDVLDIRIPAHSDRAFVQFSRREDAEAALTAPDAVMGNRFIRLSWANRDSIAGVGDTAPTSTVTDLPEKSTTMVSAGLVATRNRKVGEKVGANGTGIATSETTSTEVLGKVISANGTSASLPSPGAALKKQEELDHLRDEIRKKQDALAQKRDDFRRKLNNLEKQGVSGKSDTSEIEHPAKRLKIEDAEGSVAMSSCKQGVNPGATASQLLSSSGSAPLDHPASSAGLTKTNSGELPKPTASVSAMPMSQPQPSPRSGRLLHTRSIGSGLTYGSPMTWGPQRFKLDNRTTVFRIQPPFPTAATDIALLKDHFAMFGELAGIEVEDAEGQKQGGIKLNDTTFVRVSYTTRRAAERAFAQGRLIQGQNLQLVWVTSVPSTSGVMVVSRRPDMSEKASSHSKTTLGSSLLTDTEVVKGSKSVNKDINIHSQESQVTVTEETVSGEETGMSSIKEEQRVSRPIQSLQWRKDSLLEMHVTVETGLGSGDGPGGQTETSMETVL